MRGPHLPGRVDGFVALDEGFQPSQDALPPVAMAGRGFDIAGEAFLADVHQSAGAGLLGTVGVQSVNAVRLEFPADDGLLRATVTADPRMNEQARGIDFQMFAFHVEGLAVGADAALRHLPPGRTSMVDLVMWYK